MFEIPFAWLLALHFDMGPRGLYYAIVIAFCLLAAVSAILFQKGAWKTKVV